MYFFDSDTGEQRREMLMEKVSGLRETMTDTVHRLQGGSGKMGDRMAGKQEGGQSEVGPLITAASAAMAGYGLLGRSPMVCLLGLAGLNFSGIVGGGQKGSNMTRQLSQASQERGQQGHQPDSGSQRQSGAGHENSGNAAAARGSDAARSQSSVGHGSERSNGGQQPIRQEHNSAGQASSTGSIGP